MDLTQLQNYCRRDPSGYKDEFLTQLEHFRKQIELFKLKPSSQYKQFQEQVRFLTHVKKKKKLKFNFLCFFFFQLRSRSIQLQIKKEDLVTIQSFFFSNTMNF